jgi:hypothetical protein
MKRPRISASLRAKITAAAKHRCGYCQTQIIVIGSFLTVDHIVPLAAGGKTEENNLWLACNSCNIYKGDRTHYDDPQSGLSVALFNPRTQEWDEHFLWSGDGIFILGKTEVGRATIDALKLNNEYIVRSRRRWVSVGWHPPQA